MNGATLKVTVVQGKVLSGTSFRQSTNIFHGRRFGESTHE